jgi:thiol-disulfide isomerase/thioredoxin
MNKKAPAKAGQAAPSRARRRRRWSLAAAVGVGAMIGLTILAVQGMHPAPRHSTPGGSSGADFRIVAYQGEAVLGGKETEFGRVFDSGKPVVLNFWAGACASCNVEMPSFQKLATEYSGKVTVVGVDVGPFTGLGTHEDAVKLYTQLGIRYPLAYAVDASPLQLYGVQGMPTTVFLAANGQVVDTVTGILTEDQLRSEIEQKLVAS